MKLSDTAAVVFFVLLCLLVVFFPLDYTVCLTKSVFTEGTVQGTVFTGFTCKGLEQFGHVTKAFPYLMGFCKFCILATFGEMLKNRIKSGSWKITRLPARAFVWGLFGMVMTLAFALFAGGVASMQSITASAWLFKADSGFWKTFLFAFQTSCCMNFIFAYPMMLAHEYCNTVIEKKHFPGGEEFFSGLNPKIWGSFIPKTILYFWIPAHTVTFFLPADFRVLSGALLSMALGFILTLRAVKKTA